MAGDKRKPDDRGRSNTGGYGRPPVEHQFKPGQSGNPKGRPKTSKPGPESSLETLVRIGSQTVKVMKGGAPCEMTSREAVLHRLYADAANGKPAALKLLLSYLEPIDAHLKRQQEVKLPDFRSMSAEEAARAYQRFIQDSDV